MHAGRVEKQNIETGIFAYVTLSTLEEIYFLMAQIWDVLQKQVISVVSPQNRERGFYSAYLLVLKKTKNFRPISLEHTHMSHKQFCTLTLKLLKLVQLLDWHLSQLGFAVNWKKSSPHPLEYLGAVLDAHALRAFLLAHKR